MTVQSVSSVVRQVLAVLVTVFGVVVASTQSLHLPVAVTTILTAFAPVMLTIEHYLGDPSTGTPAQTTTTTTPAGSPIPNVTTVTKAG